MNFQQLGLVNANDTELSTKDLQGYETNLCRSIANISMDAMTVKKNLDARSIIIGYNSFLKSNYNYTCSFFRKEYERVILDFYITLTFSN